DFWSSNVSPPRQKSDKQDDVSPPGFHADSKMHLEINSVRTLHDPDQQSTLAEIDALSEDEFLVLVRGEHDYVQTYLNEDGTWTLEYRGGSEDQHFATEEAETTIDDVKLAFAAFVNEHDVAGLLPWQLIDLTPDAAGEDEVEFNGLMKDQQ
ncbi:MAG: hypothetical protein AAFN70_16205, partial [Planctomycetota bacterium]